MLGDLRNVTMNEKFMRIPPLLHNSCHRQKITPVTITLEWELSID